MQARCQWPGSSRPARGPGTATAARRACAAWRAPAAPQRRGAAPGAPPRAAPPGSSEPGGPTAAAAGGAAPGPPERRGSGPANPLAVGIVTAATKALRALGVGRDRYETVRARPPGAPLAPGDVKGLMARLAGDFDAGYFITGSIDECAGAAAADARPSPPPPRAARRGRAAPNCGGRNCCCCGPGAHWP